MVLTNIVSAFGLAGAAGLNAYIPLLIVAILGRAEVIKLSEPFDLLTSWWAIGALVTLLVVEFIVDKVPGADHVNDIVQTIVRPAAGAVLFAANAGLVKDASPVLALGLGLLLAFGVHATKATARPVINAATLGVGAPVVSIAEDVTSIIASILAVFAPVLYIIFILCVAYILFRVVRRVQRKRTEKIKQNAI